MHLGVKLVILRDFSIALVSIQRGGLGVAETKAFTKTLLLTFL